MSWHSKKTKSGDVSHYKDKARKKIEEHSQEPTEEPDGTKRDLEFREAREGRHNNNGYNDFSIHKNYYDIDYDASNGSMKLSLGNMTDTGWYWNGEEEDINGFLIRLNKSQADSEFLIDISDIPFSIFKNQIKKNLAGKLENNDDGLYAISGDNTAWHFGEGEPDVSAREQFFDDGRFSDEDEGKIMDEAYMNPSTDYSYGDFIAEHGEELRKNLLEILERSNTMDEYFDELNDERFTYPILEDRVMGAEGVWYNAIAESAIKLEKSGEIKKQSD